MALKFAAYTSRAIYGIGDTEAEAVHLANVIRGHRIGVSFKVSPISNKLLIHMWGRKLGQLLPKNWAGYKASPDGVLRDYLETIRKEGM